MNKGKKMTEQTKYKPIFYSDLTILDNGRDKLIGLLRKHLVLYNQALDAINKNPQIRYKELYRKIKEQNEDTGSYDPASFSIELHYLYRKFRLNRRNKKLVTNVQYLTYIVTKEETFKYIKIDRNSRIIHLINPNIMCSYEGDMPEFKENIKHYINIGYSANEDTFKVSIFDSRNSER